MGSASSLNGNPAVLRLPRLYVEYGVRRIAAGLDMAPSQQDAQLAAAAEGCRACDYAALAGLVRPVLAAGPWTWPWFDSRADYLHGLGVWPAAWRHRNIAPGARWDGVAGIAREEILLHTLCMSVANAHNTARIANPANRRLFAITLKVQDEHCPAERLVCEMHRAAIEAYDFSELPPYFPMCGVHPRVKPLGDTL